MKSRLFYVILFGMVVPVALMAYLSRQARPASKNTEPPQTTESTEPSTLSVLTDSGLEQMDWSDYLTGVVLGEMPVDFHPEALKAQAVVARTYARKRLEGGKHDGAVCTAPSCCQGYVMPQEYLESGGEEKSVEKVAQAVADTQGQVLTYEGALIDATYFSCSGGSTEAAVEVWGADVPYLQSVESPGEEIAEHYTDSVTFSPNELAQKLNIALPADEPWLGSVTYTEGGGVDTVTLAGKNFTGKELRGLLGLRSTVFTVEVDGNITFHTKGYGHRVGMSQYGAQAMALEGAGYEAILAHYYQGTTLETAAP